MKKRLAIAIWILSGISVLAQHKDILGACTSDDLRKEPFAGWYVKNYDDYQPNQEMVKRFRKGDLENVKIKIIFGTWCGDSKREVPRMAKFLDALAFPKNKIEWIAVDDSTEVYKQSPGHEERGLDVYRVPTFIVYSKDHEVGRIVEYPAESLERDFASILHCDTYTPNYFSYPVVKKWLANGMLTDPNVSARGLASSLYGKVQYEAELNACGYVLLAQGKMAEAITIFRINVSLFPKSANCYDSLAEAYVKAGLKDKAVQSYENALKIEPENERLKAGLKKLKS